jgi:hypothetical protein
MRHRSLLTVVVVLLALLGGFNRIQVLGADAPLPYPWAAADVGDVGQPGATSYSGGVFQVAGAGADIWGPTDAFQFVSQSMGSDGYITARVTGITNTGTFAKAGVMFRAGPEDDAATAILDVKPDGGIEFMVRQETGGTMSFIAGAFTSRLPVRLKLQRNFATVTSEYIAYVYDDVRSAWTQIGFAAVATGAEALVGLAVTSHDTGVLNTSSFDNVAVFKNLLQKWSFEEYSPPALGTPGWISDTPFRQIDAKSETNQPHNGAKNGACWATTNEDCGIYQEAIAPYDANYVFTIFANGIGREASSE